MGWMAPLRHLSAKQVSAVFKIIAWKRLRTIKCD
jgi:hypothetical protein